jgi:hypothetical protein
MARAFVSTSTQYLEVLSSPISGVPFTFGCWIYPTQDTAQQSFFAIADLSAGDDYYILQVRGTDAGDPVGLTRRDPGTGTITAKTSNGITVNTWHHVCGVINAVNDVEIFLDADTGNKGSSVTSVNPATIEMRIGAGYGGPATDPFDGYIAEAAIWNVALADEEIGVLARGARPMFIRPGSLMAYWPLLYSTNEEWKGRHSLTAFNGPTMANHPPRVNVDSLDLPIFVPHAPITKQFWQLPYQLFKAVGQCVWVSPPDGSEMVSRPQLVFTMPTATGNMHFEMQLDTVSSFDGDDLRIVKSHQDQTGWEYWDGDVWVAVPATGVPNTYSGNQCRYTVQTALT